MNIDDRFILKEISKKELESFLNFANYYFEHISSYVNEGKLTLLAKIVGLYKISYKNTITNSSTKMYLLVMENLFYKRKVVQKFDLKGSVRNRLANTSQPENVVLLDENLIRMIRDTPLYVRNHSKKLL